MKQSRRHQIRSQADSSSRQLVRELQRGASVAKALLNATPDAIITINDQGVVEDFNPAACRIFGYEAHEVIGHNVGMLMPDGVARKHNDYIARYLRTGEKKVIGTGREVTGLKKDRSEVPLYLSIGEVHVGPTRLFTGILQDLAEIRERESRLIFEAAHDALTGLINRRELNRQLAAAMRSAKAYRGTLLYLDLDHFKPINDNLGHSVGDRVLQALVDRLVRCLPADATLARVGGDEFCILAPRDSVTTAMELAACAVRATESFRFAWDHRTIQLGVSVGVTLFTPGDRPERVIRRADAACYEAKARGRNRVHLYQREDPALDLKYQVTDWALRLPTAIMGGHLRLFHQRILPATDTTDTGWSEILARLADPHTGKLIPPAIFMTAAETYNLASHVDMHVVKRVLATIEDTDTSADLSVNISATTLGDERACKRLHTLLNNHPAGAAKLILEVTETAILFDIRQSVAWLRAYRDAGARIAIDDFGTGHSSLIYLADLPFDVLKLDGSLIHGMTPNSKRELIVGGICRIARDLGRPVVAEFVCDEAQIEPLQRIGVDFLQGYHLHRPEPWPMD